MRLINCKSLESLWLEGFEPSNAPKKYAILSHTWERAQRSEKTLEVLFDDFPPNTHRRDEINESGWRKIEEACREAKAFDNDIEYLWVDSCCINKKDVAELSEAINSMFQWYAHSTVCLAYLSDVSDAKADALDPSARWFTRGWTLQELVASPRVRFYDKDWHFIGDKVSLSGPLAEITSVDVELLRAVDEQTITRKLCQIPACQKMSWASRRRTTKVEDTAYCLLGIFDIQMPLLYGEREAAFKRLQEAIVNKYNDLTILAWKARNTHPKTHTSKHVMYHSWESGLVGQLPDSGVHECYHGIFACSPMEFEHSGSISSCFPQPSIFNPEYAITNKGLKMTSMLRKSGPFGSSLMALMCRVTKTSSSALEQPETVGEPIGIFLKWVGGNTYVRSNCTELKTLRSEDLEQSTGQDEFYLATSVEQLHHCVNDLRRWSIRLPHPGDMFVREMKSRIVNVKVSPGSMWDDEERIFYTYGHQNPVGCATYSFSGSRDPLFMVFFGLHFNGRPWLCLVEPHSDLFPSHVERRREFLTRTAPEARRRSTAMILINATRDELESCQTLLAVNGSFKDTGISGRVQAYDLELSLEVTYKYGLASSDTGKSSADSTHAAPTYAASSANVEPRSETTRGNGRLQSVASSASMPNTLHHGALSPLSDYNSAASSRQAPTRELSTTHMRPRRSASRASSNIPPVPVEYSNFGVGLTTSQQTPPPISMMPVMPQNATPPSIMMPVMPMMPRNMYTPQAFGNMMASRPNQLPVNSATNYQYPPTMVSSAPTYPYSHQQPASMLFSQSASNDSGQPLQHNPGIMNGTPSLYANGSQVPTTTGISYLGHAPTSGQFY